MIHAEDMIQVTLPQVTVVDARRQGKRTARVRRNAELVANQGGTA